MELRSISGLVLRRAMFAVLLDAGGPVSVGEVVAALHADGVTAGSWTRKPPRGAYSWMRKLLNCQGSSWSTESASSEKFAKRSRRLDTGSQSEGPECSSPR